MKDLKRVAWTVARAGAAAMLVLASTGGVSHAAGSWSPPRELAGEAHAIVAPGVLFTSNGRGVLAMTRGGEDDVALATGPEAGDTFTSAGIFRPARRVQAGDNGNVAVYGRSGLVLAGVTPSNRVAVVLGRIGGTTGRRKTIGPPLPAAAPRVVANGDGDMAVVAFVQARAHDLRTLAPILIVGRRGRFGRPLRLGGPSRAYAGALDVAIDARGDVLAAWQRGRNVVARYRTAAGRLRAPQTLGANGHAQISVALAADRSGIVAWEARDLSATEVRASRSNVRGHFAKRSFQLEHFDGHVDATACNGASPDPRLVRVAATPAGQPIVAWTARESRRSVVRAAVGKGATSFRFTPLVYGPTGSSCLSDVATRPDGAATVLWSRSTLQEGVVDLRAATLPPGGTAFPVPAEVATGTLPGARLGVDPLTGTAVAAWITEHRTLATSARTP